MTKKYEIKIGENQTVKVERLVAPRFTCSLVKDEDGYSAQKLHWLDAAKSDKFPSYMMEVGQLLSEAKGGVFPNPAAAEMGRLGGLSTSDLKAEAARINGKKGGRPKKQRASAA